MRSAAHRLLLTSRRCALTGGDRAEACLASAAIPASQFPSLLATRDLRGFAAEAAADNVHAPAPQETSLDEPTAPAARQPYFVKPPYRFRSDAARELDERTLDFAARMFAADLDAAPAVSEVEEQEQEQQLSLWRPAQAEALTAAAGTASLLPTEGAAAESSSSSSSPLEASAAAQYASRAAARKKRSALLQQRAAKLVGFDVWLDEHAEQAAAFVAVADKLGVQAEPLLLHIFKSRATHLLTCACSLCCMPR